MKAKLLTASVALLASVGPRAVAAAPDPVANKFLGAWKLVSTEQRLVDGSTRPSPLFGPNGVGYLMYTATHMCAVLMNPDRFRWTSPQAPTDQEVRAAFNGFAAYCGPYEVDAAKGIVTHHVELDKTPAAVGTLRKRYFAFSDDRLVLRPLPQQGAGTVELSLTWQRVGK